ncbi:uncharacterized protein TNIN_3501 [Trichonephila inaurata madagascariensis]|uniref:Uncharacterized protein n=1 Tax=Trichonephila inaurata madagascariensis TaxID=2747483 RepID=A0A8X6WPJ4_9ARAC|nr:uncharacterized protein TNIN_3501 [Trichonephila inaurata madagascariensis]
MNCIFGSDKSKCQVDSNWSFQKVICSHHLREVYGLDIWYYKLETESATHVVGPFLIVKSDFSFKKNDVVFPEKGFIDKIYRSKDVTLTEEDLQFRLNPKIVEYVQQLVTAAEKNDSRSDQRYQYEIIRNISESDINAIDMGYELSGESFSNFLVHLKGRLSSLHEFIKSSNSAGNFKKISVLSTASLTPLENNNFSPFYKFLIANCMVDVHLTPFTNTLAEMIMFNLVYKPGIGFFVTEETPHPMPLVVAGREQGHQHLYYQKTATYNKKTVPKTLTRKEMPDNRAIFNPLKGASDGCLF